MNNVVSSLISMTGIICLLLLGITAMITGTDHALLQLIIGGIIGMVSTAIGVVISQKKETNK